MHMKPKVVVDTNAINNEGIGNGFLGRTKELKKIINKIELFIPEIVINEIREHKRKSFYKERESLLGNDLFKLVDIDRDKVNKLNVNDIIERDYKSNDIPFTILPMGDMNEFFIRFGNLLIKNKPPFATKGDKGIKDALIAYSIDKLLERIEENEKLILVSSDGRLKEYYEDNNRVRATDDIVGIVKLIEHDDGLLIKTNTKTKIEFAGIREKTSQEKKIEKMLTNFRNSINFKKTHEFINLLKKNERFLTLENKADIIRSALNNNQIRWIVNDYDVSNYLVPLYYECSNLLTIQEQFEFEMLVGINHNAIASYHE